MYLYLVQHGEAKSKEEDPARSLSEKGMEDVRKIADRVRQLNVEVGRIMHSGKMRALQTAQEMGNHIKVAGGILEADGLAPMDDPALWSARLADTTENTMLVGHLPHLGRLSALLLCSDTEKEVVSFAVGSVVCLKRSDSGQWVVDWILKPEMVL
jgi:phosphohistidine phosphatase